MSYFLALDLPDTPAGFTPHLLTPMLMQWNSILLMDLSVTRAYWKAMASAEKLPWEQVIRGVLADALASQGVTLRAAMAPHPWKAILLLAEMRERGIGEGFLAFDSAVARSIYQNLSMDAWFTSAGEYCDHASACRLSKFDGKGYRQNLRRLREAVARIGLEKLWHLKKSGVDHPAISRRFGKVSQLWEWTYETAPLIGSLDGFPWIAWTPNDLPSVHRHLDFPLWAWDQISDFLAEDFDRLCLMPSWTERERVTRIRWQLTLIDLSQMDVPIAFRQPHALHREIGHQRTAILQAHFAFSAVLRQMQESGPRLHDAAPQPIISWTLSIERRLVLAHVVRTLFGETDSSGKAREQELLALENQLPVALTQYDLCDDWLPESSFRENDPKEDQDKGQLELWKAMAEIRPLFMYARPRQLICEPPKERKFLERISEKWWQGDGTVLRHRDYFRYEDRGGFIHWGFRSSDDIWYVHGSYI